jgi:hypothetical protein
MSENNVWQGKTGAEIRKIIQTTLNTLNATAKNTEDLLDRAFDSKGNIRSEVLPSYVDDVIEGYMEKSKTNDVLTCKTAAGNVIDGEIGKIYVNLNTDVSKGPVGGTYRFLVGTFPNNPDNYVKISDSDMENQINDLSVKYDNIEYIYDENFMNINGTLYGLKDTIKKILNDLPPIGNVYYCLEEDQIPTNKNTPIGSLIYIDLKDTSKWPRGLYECIENTNTDPPKWQRVGGLL